MTTASTPTTSLLDVELSTSGGHPVSLSAFAGRPVLLFFESRDAKDLNKRLKDRLFEEGKRRGLTSASSVVAVANVEPFNFFPARDFAQAAVRREERRWGIPILLDWRGVLASPPWSLPKDSSAIVLLDARGAVRFRHVGALDGETAERFFETLWSLLEPRQAAASDPNVTP